MEGLAMFRMGMLARLVMLVLVASTLDFVVAAEPVGTTPPAQSIREWKSTSTAVPAANAPLARSIREWKTTPIAAPAAPAASPCSMPPANPAAMPAVSEAAAKSPITISITSTLRHGNLVVMLDDVPIFNEKFQKPLLLISQTTTWDAVQIPAGQHRLSAKVYGTKKTYLSALYDVNVSRTKASALRFVMQGDKLTVEVAS
jgi:hypothetical protein